MFKAIALAAILAGAVVAPAAAQSFDPNYAGGPPAGNWDGNGRGGPGWDGNGRGGPGGPQGDFRRPGRYDSLPPRQIARILRYQGYFGANILNRRGDVFIVRAASRGRDFILVVDSRSGDVLRARPAGPSWNDGNGWHGGWGQDWRRW
jgi:hypothetical protein